ncbi:hypothetical protein K1719_046217 [Acacia pycnantha]|nr:hypothetical protein K1719_046217 [Acacia pycnantha]
MGFARSLGSVSSSFCSKEKEYNDLATIFFNIQDDAIRNLFSAKTIHEFSAQSLLTFLALTGHRPRPGLYTGQAQAEK